jgi:hypothetical protein
MRRRLNYTHPTHPSRQRYTPQILRNQADGGCVYSCVWFCDNFTGSTSASCIRLPNHTHYTHPARLPCNPLERGHLAGRGRAMKPCTADSFCAQHTEPPPWRSSGACVERRTPAPSPSAGIAPAAPASASRKRACGPRPHARPSLQSVTYGCGTAHGSSRSCLLSSSCFLGHIPPVPWLLPPSRGPGASLWSYGYDR